MSSRLFRHYKTGKVYELVGRAVHSETQEALVLYKEYDSHNTRIWARPKPMFFDTVEYDGRFVSRFTEITDSDANE